MPTLMAGTLVLAMPDVSGLTPYACVTPVFAHLLPEVVAFTAVLLIFIQRRRSLGWPSETNRPKILFWTKGALWVGAAITLWCTAVSALVYATGFTPVPTGVGLFQQVVQATCLLCLLSYLPPTLIGRKSSAADAEVANTIIPEKFAKKQTKTPIKIAGYLAMVCTIASACLWKTTCILQSWADPTTLREGYSLIVTTLLLALLELVDITRVGNRGAIRVCLVCLAILLTTGIAGSAITLVRSADPEYMLDFQVLRTMEAACVVLQTLALIFDVRFGVHISSADINASDSSKPSANMDARASAAADGRTESRIQMAMAGISQLDRDSKLTTREKEVLALTSIGKTTRQIADKLSISTSSVSTYRSRALHKLGCSSKDEFISKMLTMSEGCECTVATTPAKDLRPTAVHWIQKATPVAASCVLAILCVVTTRTLGIITSKLICIIVASLALCACAWLSLQAKTSALPSSMPVEVPSNQQQAAPDASVTQSPELQGRSSRDISNKHGFVEDDRHRFILAISGLLCGSSVAISMATITLSADGVSGKTALLEIAAATLTFSMAWLSFRQPYNTSNISSTIWSSFGCGGLLGYGIATICVITASNGQGIANLLALPMLLGPIVPGTMGFAFSKATQSAINEANRYEAMDAYATDEGPLLYLRGRGLGELQAKVALATALGFSRKAIAKHEHVSPLTVDSYRTRAYSQLHVGSKAELAEILRREGGLSK